MAVPTAEQIRQSYGGYVGWNDPSAIVADYLATGGAGKGNSPFALGGGGVAPQQTNQPQPLPPTMQSPQPQQQQQMAPSGGGQPQSAQDLIAMGFQGYQGWGNAEAIADFKATGGQGKGGPSSGGAALSFTQPTINLPEIYQSLYDTSGIREIEENLASRTKAFNDAQAKINDNPYLSEATRVGRIAKLQDQFNNDTKATTDQLAMKKADIETQLNLQMKQFDIQSQQAQTAFNQFQSLLSAGALDNVSGETIASITRSTGLSSDMIMSAIDANKKKNVQTSIQQYDDGNNQGFVVINSQTGEIISRQVVAQSEPRSTGGGTASERESEQLNQIRDDLISEARRGATWDALYRLGLGFLDPKDIYAIYQAYGIYNPSGDDRTSDLERYGIN